jgi:hypothetical protein
MKKAVTIFLLAFYSFGTFCLPMGDFSTLNCIPEMYRHCKTTEDKDMTAFDFITDHLLNVDGLFDKHENGDEQKPHQPLQNHHPVQTTVTCISYFAFSISWLHPINATPPVNTMNFHSSDYISKLFRPPIFA